MLRKNLKRLKKNWINKIKKEKKIHRMDHFLKKRPKKSRGNLQNLEKKCLAKRKEKN